jgi:hypothetical protein
MYVNSVVVDTATYRARIGPFLPETTKKRAKKDQGEGEMWFFGIILIAQLVRGGVETNPDPIVWQDKIDQLQSHVQNQRQQNLTEGHNNEISDMEKRTTDFEGKLEVNRATK